jgi:hypothetical protein
MVKANIVIYIFKYYRGTAIYVRINMNGGRLY